MIPELEAAIKDSPPRNILWTETELAVIRQYYQKVDTGVLAKYLKRTISSVQIQGRRIRATERAAQLPAFVPPEKGSLRFR